MIRSIRPRLGGLTYPFLLIFALALPGGGEPAAQENPALDAAAELVAHERARATVEAALELYHEQAEDGRQEIENFIVATRELVAAGDAVVPFLTSEIDQALQESFFLCAYALGHFDHPEAEAALRRAIERAERDDGDFAVIRKAWAAYGLGLQGHADAVNLVNEGKHQAGHYPFHAGTTAVETIAIQTAPASVPLLVSQLTRYRDDEILAAERLYTIRALGRIADPSAAPPLIETLSDRNPLMRRAAARALTHVDADGVTAALVAALGDDDERVRRGVASALEEREIGSTVPLAVARLEVEESAVVRGSLYRMLARLEGQGALETLARYQGRPDPLDRFHLVDAIGMIESDRILTVLRDGFGDPDSRIRTRAVAAVSRLGTPAAIELLAEATRARHWPLVQLTAEEAGSRGITALGEPLARRLIEVELASPIDPRRRSRVEILGDTLVRLGHTERTDEIAAAIEKQRDPEARRILEELVAELELLRKNGTKVRRWTESLSADAAEQRALSIFRLGQLGGERAAKALVASFGRVDPSEAIEILRGLGGIDTPDSRALLRRVLLEPTFDAIERLELRDMAAWSARRLGGDDMIEALREAVRRRDGREAAPMVYLALLDGTSALPVLEELRVPRMRYLKWMRGNEQRVLDRLARRIERGLPTKELDVPPDRLSFR